MDLEKRKEISKKIETSFVEDFNLINDAKNKINLYLSDMDITELYNYNEFCIIFMDTTDTLLGNLTTTEFQNLPLENFISEILSIMVQHKISECTTQTEEQKSFNLLKIEIDKFKMNKRK